MASFGKDPITGETTVEGPFSIFDPATGYTGSEADKQLLADYQQSPHSRGLPIWGTPEYSALRALPPNGAPSSTTPTPVNIPTAGAPGIQSGMQSYNALTPYNQTPYGGQGSMGNNPFQPPSPAGGTMANDQPGFYKPLQNYGFYNQG